MGNPRMSPKWIDRVTVEVGCAACEHHDPLYCARLGEAVFNKRSQKYECPANLTDEQRADWVLRDQRREQRSRWDVGSRSRPAPLPSAEHKMLAQVAARYWDQGLSGEEVCNPGGPLHGKMTTSAYYEAVIAMRNLRPCSHCGILMPGAVEGVCQYCQEEAAGIFQILHEVSGFGEYSGDVPRPEPFYGMPGSEPE